MSTAQEVWLGVSQHEEVVLEEAVLSYAAGLFDGEGNATITRALPPDQNRPVYRLVAVITNTNAQLLQKLRDTLQLGTLCSKMTTIESKWKDSYSLVFNQGEAYKFLRLILPYLILKKEQAENCLAFAQLKMRGAAGEDTFAEQEKLYFANKKLNARGKSNQIAYDNKRKGKAVRERCAEEGCDKEHYAFGYCKQHYRWRTESTSFERNQERKCKNCLTPLPAHFRIDRLFCSVTCKMKHHRREGCYAEENKVLDFPKCSIENCDKPVHGKSLCRSHYMRQRRAERQINSTH